MSDFHALNARRRNERNARLTFLVKKVNKDGSVSRMAFTEMDWRYNAFEARDAADARAVALAALNPGSKYAVVPSHWQSSVMASSALFVAG